MSFVFKICYLIKELKNRLDIEEIPFFAAVELSYLKEDEQNIIEDILTENKFRIDLKKSQVLRDYSEKNKLDEETANSILSGELNKKAKPNKPATIKLKPKLISKYFKPEVKQPEIEEIIDKALKLYFDSQGKEVLDE